MDNTVGRYEPDNELFRTLVLMVLCFIFIAFYTIIKIRNANELEWYDWAITGLVAGVIMLMYAKTQKKLK